MPSTDNALSYLNIFHMALLSIKNLNSVPCHIYTLDDAKLTLGAASEELLAEHADILRACDTRLGGFDFVDFNLVTDINIRNKLNALIQLAKVHRSYRFESADS